MPFSATDAAQAGSTPACRAPSVGAGLSSSAAFEVLIGRIFNELFNHGDATRLDIARAARHAENVHFGKPAGSWTRWPRLSRAS
ncbi:GHMP family kinase ATP-binding protein [Salidesulfovibrio brasiliensis]|uniref:GHMP family kinase ATP-binding protein n=1 Tax=Salidesulfovibrio brasiliensis TaxID=221711 RepID=UPI001FE030A3|nr:hypothetical protein [Salidesulfovibrio brasiliensis]